MHVFVYVAMVYLKLLRELIYRGTFLHIYSRGITILSLNKYKCIF
jgi:hypothetical protein